MPSIFELTKEQRKLMNAIESGELSKEAAEDTLDGMVGELDDKIDAYCGVLNKLNLQLDAIKSEKDRIESLQKEKENEINRVKSFMIFALQVIDKTKFDTGLHKGHIRKGREKLVSKPGAVAPDEFVTTMVTEKVDNSALTAAIKSGESFEGFSLERGESTIVIK